VTQIPNSSIMLRAADLTTAARQFQGLEKVLPQRLAVK
jgi:hypothetical protein